MSRVPNLSKEFVAIQSGANRYNVEYFRARETARARNAKRGEWLFWTACAVVIIGAASLTFVFV